MKRTFLCVGIASLLLLSCQSDDPTPIPNPRKDIPLTRPELEMAALGNEFAFKLFKTITGNEEKENVFISPLSASIALSMTANGAAGSTREEMRSVLGFKDYSMEEMNEYYRKLVKGLLAVDHSTTLGIANSIWVKEGFEVKQPFIDLNKDMYDAEVRNLDFGSPQAVNTINRWCSDKTNKRITKVLDKIGPDARLFLINALYFKGAWTSKFDKRNTVSGDFTTVSGRKNKAEMMRQECNTLYATDEGLQIVELPYGNEAFGMTILLPEKGQDIDNVTGRLTPENWKEWTRQLSACTIDIKLPKFKLEYSRDLIEDLMKMGMTVPFGNSADFSNMSDAGLCIGMVKQDAFVEVNEEGTEAAAVTIVGMDLASAGEPQVIPFHVDRPFIYIIKEKSTGAILFMGKIGTL
jgi:serpin B